MKIIWNQKEYEVILDHNTTVDHIVSQLPLKLTFQEYASHEYYSELPFTPVFDQTRTTFVKAGHLYYWDGWNAFVFNYIDSDISPYHVVHIGGFKDHSIIKELEKAEKYIELEVID